LFAEIIPKLVDVVKLRIVYVPLPQQPWAPFVIILAAYIVWCRGQDLFIFLMKIKFLYLKKQPWAGHWFGKGQLEHQVIYTHKNMMYS
jgi:hypothetical protein